MLPLAAAYWLDYAIFWLRQRAGQTFDYTFMLWAPALAQLLLAGYYSGLTAMVIEIIGKNVDRGPSMKSTAHGPHFFLAIHR